MTRIIMLVVWALGFIIEGLACFGNFGHFRIGAGFSSGFFAILFFVAFVATLKGT